LSYQPTYFEEEVKEEHWVQAMNEEIETIEAIERNDTWDLVDLLTNKTNIGVRWVYKTRLHEKGNIDKHKAMLILKGFSQWPHIEYGETFAPVSRLDTIRVVKSIASQNKWLVYQVDVKLSFFNGNLEE